MAISLDRHAAQPWRPSPCPPPRFATVTGWCTRCIRARRASECPSLH